MLAVELVVPGVAPLPLGLSLEPGEMAVPPTVVLTVGLPEGVINPEVTTMVMVCNDS